MRFFCSESNLSNLSLYLGINLDCAVIFTNGGSDIIEFFEGTVFIEWEEVGPVERTDCRVGEAGTTNGQFVDCMCSLVF